MSKTTQKIFDQKLDSGSSLAEQIRSAVEKTKRDYERMYHTPKVEVFVQQVILDAPIVTFIFNIKIED